MAEHDDDDPSLKAMRGVWLSMREEDPPSSGLDALMAAARSQASIMVKPNLWQRIAATMKRPPVLAFASIAILVGGAVIVTRHSDAVMEKAPAAPPPLMDTSAPTAAGKAEVRQVAPVTAPTPAPERKEQVIAKPKPAMHVSPQKADEQMPRKAAIDKPAESPNGALEDQLAAQARSAATRGDCEAARSIGARIARRDAAYYRDHVANDLAGCTVNADADH